MHPIERLRYMARAGDVATAPLVHEAALALGSVAHDQMELVTACRQLIDHRPASGPLMWLAARMISGVDPSDDGWAAAEAVQRDTTARELGVLFASDATVVVVDAPELVSSALADRVDVEALVIDVNGDGYGLVHRLEVADHTAVDIAAAGTAAAVAEADVVVLETDAMGPDAALVPMGSAIAAACAAATATPVWLVAGVGRCLPDSMWQALRDRAIDRDPWEASHEVLDLGMVDLVVGPGGPVPLAEARLRTDCPIAPELL